MDMIRTISRNVKDDDESNVGSSSSSSNAAFNRSSGGGSVLRVPTVEPSTGRSIAAGVAVATTSSVNDVNGVVHAVVADHNHSNNNHYPLSTSGSVAQAAHLSPSASFVTGVGGAVVTTATTAEDETSAGRSGSEACPAEIPCELADQVCNSSRHEDEDDLDNNDDDDSDDEEDYEYEDEDETPFTGFLVDNPTIVGSRSEEQDAAVASGAAHAPTKIEDEEVIKPKWREPTREAVSMSLRAEQETSGSKRRLAQDLYRIMNQDTQEAGFSLQPSSEDSMDKWTIKLFQFDEDSCLAKDMRVLGVQAVELEMTFPDQYPFEPPFVRVVRPRFKKQTGFVMNGALCMELLTKDGWNPINDIESVIVSVRSLLVVGDGRLEAAANLTETKYAALLAASESKESLGEASASSPDGANKRQRKNSAGDSVSQVAASAVAALDDTDRRLVSKQGGSYSVSEAKAAYSHLSDYHKKKGWDSSGWWARKG